MSTPEHVPESWVNAESTLRLMLNNITAIEREFGIHVHHLVVPEWVYDAVRPLLGDDNSWRAPGDRLFTVLPDDRDETEFAAEYEEHDED